MVEILNNMQVKLPIGELQSGTVKQHQSEPSEFPTSTNSDRNSFSQAIYGDSGYSLIRPNNRTELLAQNIDYIA